MRSNTRPAHLEHLSTLRYDERGGQCLSRDGVDTKIMTRQGVEGRPGDGAWDDRAWTVDREAAILVTGAAGFVGSRVVGELLRLGFQDVRCSVRRSSDLGLLQRALPADATGRYQILEANLLSRADCLRACDGVELVYHLVAGRGKSFPSCFQGSVVTTRNLLDATLERGALRRFVNVSSFAVYSNFNLCRGSVWDEECPLENKIE